MIEFECPECEKNRTALFPTYNALSKIHKKLWNGKLKPDFCQTCLKDRLEILERLFAEKDKKC